MAHKLRNTLKPGDLVLVYNKTLESKWGLPFKNRWNGHYRVINQIKNGPYELEELGGTKLKRKFQQVTSRGSIPEEGYFNQAQSHIMKAENELKLKIQYWRRKKLNKKMNKTFIGNHFNWTAGDNIKWRGGCGILYH
ncbi:hypothetical protein O181_073501 [Austropuccinia psidii MF-1]|uniref:Uncharacterized protein n=1 Tax=Austropuccinia psidii MF-1 TaxID=1389203 RepID=A0A9Q3I8C3_9BASI|nr:hypothetical protein [Austropuccinia psidii MF-1]